MLADVTWIDAVAFVWFVAVWFGYSIVMSRFVDRIPAINQRMARIRRHWMAEFLRRENRIFDSQLVGQTIASVTFFASTSVLVLAGLLGVLGAVDSAWQVVGESGIAVATSRAFFEVKLLLLVVIFIYGFLKFTWSLRQYNYTCALMGAAPPPESPEALREALADELATAVTEAIDAFNSGLRAYYFALAAFAWLIQPWLFMVATAWVAGVLIQRQLSSEFSATVGRVLDRLDEAQGRTPR